MMRYGIDFGSWYGLLTTIVGLSVVTLVMVGIRLLVMQTVQQRRERENRQINERLRTLIAAYKTLGGSFTGDLGVDPAHLRELRLRAREQSEAEAGVAETLTGELGAAAPDDSPAGERRRRVRDAVEAALSDIILLGTEEQVRLAVKAATDLTAGRMVETAQIVVSLRDFIRHALDLDPVPADLVVPKQGPTRPQPGGTRGGVRGEPERARSGRGGGGQGGGAGLAGAGVGLGVGMSADDPGQRP